jgi:hypothetical protein
MLAVPRSVSKTTTPSPSALICASNSPRMPDAAVADGDETIARPNAVSHHEVAHPPLSRPSLPISSPKIIR